MGKFLTDLDTTFRADHFSGLHVMKYAHVHAQYELYFCTENVEQKSVINGEEYIYQYPCVILSPPYTVHSMSCEDPSAVDFDRYVFYFDETMLSSYREELIPKELRRRFGGRIYRLTQEQADYLKAMLTWCDDPAFGTSAAQKELGFLLFLNKLFSFCSEEETICVDSGPDYIREVLGYVAEHFCEAIDVQSVALHFSVSRSKLDRDFRRCTGNTVHDFLESCRVNQAKLLLQLDPPLSIQEIASRCGIESESYFFPFFKRHTGITPLEYRSNKQKEERTNYRVAGKIKETKEKGEQDGKDYIYGCGEYGFC